MGRHYVSACLAVIVLLALASAPALAVGRLKIHPSNPHYFQEDGTGRAILFASHLNLVPQDITWDDAVGIAQMGQMRNAYARVWHFCPWAHGNALWPWAFSSTPGPMGMRVDMDVWNPTYWTRMHNSLGLANSVGTYAEIMLFDRCGLSPSSYDRYECNPWASDNNVNELEMPTAVGNDGTPDFYQWSTNENLKYYQEEYIKKMIDETIAYPNVIYEIENEHWQSNSSGWADHYADFIKTYIETYYPTMPTLVSYNSIESEADNDQQYGWSDIDFVNIHYGEEPEYDPTILNTYLEANWQYNKPMNIDEFGNFCGDYDILREMCWTIVSSGGHYHIEDSNPIAKPLSICENIRSFIAHSNWNFINCSPQKSLITSGGGYCMKNTGVEYLCYFPSGGNKTITLSAATYNQKWWNPRTGGFYNLGSFAHGGGGKTLATPDSNDWVLHLTTGSTPDKVLTSKYATTAITIDGASNDWVPGQSKIRGGDVGTGNIGIVGFDTDKICYIGGNRTDETADPFAIAGRPRAGNDHAATVVSRYDANYVYFMVRCDDDDVRYDNPTSANWANDCVEFYIDPGNNGGSSALSSSTSDVQLVIDANNQKNVYSTTSGYATQVLAGVSSAVSRDVKGWTLEVRLTKSAFDPDLPATGNIGIDISVRDNDNDNDPSMTTVCTWADPEVSESCPSKIPDRWGTLNLETRTDTTAPSSVTSFTATAGTGQVSLSWTNPSTADFTGTVIRYKTGSSPSSVIDGTLAVDKLGAPSSAGSHTVTGLTGGVTYYFAAFAHDEALNYSGAATANATPSAVQIYWNTLVDDTATLVGGRTPAIAVDTSGNVHVVYMVGDHVFYRTGNSALEFTAAVQIPDPADGGGYYVSPHLVLDENQVPHVVFAMYWGPDSQNMWYTNRIGGSWKTPVKVMAFTDDGRVNQPRLALGNGYAYAACFGVPSGSPYWAQSHIIRITNLSTTPTVARTANLSYWNAHPFVNSAGELWVCGRAGGAGHQGCQLDWLTLAGVGGDFYLSNTSDGITGEEFGACMDADGNIHGAGLDARFTYDDRICIWYNNKTRAASNYAILGMDATAPDWPDADVVPTLAVDNLDTTYVSYRRYETGEGWSTRIINNNAFDTPVVFTSGMAGYPRWGPSTAATSTGGIYVAWEQGGSAYIRSIGRGVNSNDSTPPGNVSNFTATAGTGQIGLSWTNPGDGDFAGTMIRFKTSGYPTSTIDGTQIYNAAGTSYTHTGLTGGVTYYYKAFAYDAVPNHASGATASGTPSAPSVSTISVKNAANLSIVIDGSSSDWALGDFTTKSRGGQNEIADYAVVGFDNGTCYYGGRCTDFVLPTSASDHTARVYSRHNEQYVFFLVRCDDNNMNYAQPTSANWANDCVEFYIDPGHEHGASAMSDSTSDIQLVIDANNQKNVYMTTSGYATQVLNGVTSAVARDGTGWWLEVRILKSAIDPDVPTTGTFGVDFAFRDNDNYDGDPIYGEPAYSTMYGWRDNPSQSSYPTKVPDKWGNANLASLSGGAPAAVTSFVAIPVDGQVSLTWHNPSDASFTGTMIRYKTSGYPTGPTDGTLVVDKSNSPNTNDAYPHTGLTNNVIYYYSAFAHDAVPNYATKADASATPVATTVTVPDTVYWSADFSWCPNGANPSSCSWTGNWTASYAYTDFGKRSFRSIGAAATQNWYRNTTNQPNANRQHFHFQAHHGANDAGNWPLWVVAETSTGKQAWFAVDSWLDGCSLRAYYYDGATHALDHSAYSGAVWHDCDIVWNSVSGTDTVYWYVNGTLLASQSLSNIGYITKVWLYNSAVNSSGSYSCIADMKVGIDNPPSVGPVTSLVALPVDGQVSLTWHNPSDASFTGTMIRYKTSGYPTGPTDGTLVVDKSNSPNTNDAYPHTGLTNNVTYYYSAFAHDAVPVYSTKADASETPVATTVTVPDTVYWGADFSCCPNGANPSSCSWTGNWTASYAYTDFGKRSFRSIGAAAAQYWYRDITSQPNANRQHFHFQAHHGANDAGNWPLWVVAETNTGKQAWFAVDSWLDGCSLRAYCYDGTMYTLNHSAYSGAVWHDCDIVWNSVSGTETIYWYVNGTLLASQSLSNIGYITRVWLYNSAVNSSNSYSCIADMKVGIDDPPSVSPVTSFAAVVANQKVVLTWHNPSDASFTGTMIRYKTTGYPTGPTDGTLVVDKSNSPNTNDGHPHTGLTNGVTYYYAAFAHDGASNYSSAATASAAPSGSLTFNAQYISNTIPSTMTPGQQVNVSVTMKNTGTSTWTYDVYKLGGVGDSDPFASARQLLNTGETVAPNASRTFSFTMTAPTTPGTYTTDWRMVQENVCWFGDTLTKQVQVGAAPGPDTVYWSSDFSGCANGVNPSNCGWTGNWTASYAYTDYGLRDFRSIGTSLGAYWYQNTTSQPNANRQHFYFKGHYGANDSGNWPLRVIAETSAGKQFWFSVDSYGGGLSLYAMWYDGQIHPLAYAAYSGAAWHECDILWNSVSGTDTVYWYVNGSLLASQSVSGIGYITKVWLFSAHNESGGSYSCIADMKVGIDDAP